MNRIRQLREKKELTQRKFVTEFNSYLVSDKNKYKDERGVKPVTFGTASRWENDLNQPTESMWNALADFFNVSVPYLKGYGYSKEHIYKCLDDAYKEPYVKGYEVEPPFTSPFLSARDAINNYCEQNKISIPKDTDLKFWQDNFSFIFKDRSVNRLLTTKDNYSDSEIKEIIINAIYWYGLNPHTRELVNKLNYKS
jgi:transcriptional regulator with XRE-family HTH domain